jgi:hypothetical protein
LEDDFGDILADLDLYHGAIAFINRYFDELRRESESYSATRTSA